MGDYKPQGRLLPWYIGGGSFMGWLIAVAAVFIAAAFLFTLSICSMAVDEDDDEEQIEWIRELREKSRNRKDGSGSH